MAHRLSRFSIGQTAKVLGVLYLLMGLIFLPFFFSKVATTSPIVASGATHPSSMSGKSSLQFSHFFPLAKRMGHQKLSTLRSISAPRAYTPVIQSQYRHQIRSCPTKPLNFWRLTFTQSAWRYRGRPTSGVRIG